MTDKIEESLGHIDTRLSLVEREVNDLASTGKWLKGIALGVVLSCIGGAVAFGEITNKMNNLNLDGMQRDIGTSLSVVASHGNEIELIRLEQHRLRGSMDSLRAEILQRTQDRFTNKEGLAHDKRLLRLEDWRIQHDNHEVRQQ